MLEGEEEMGLRDVVVGDVYVSKGEVGERGQAQENKEISGQNDKEEKSGRQDVLAEKKS